MHVESTGSKFEPLGADEDTLDGLNIHGAIVDELHAHKSRAVWDVLETGTGSRRQPLMLAITTAGTDRHSVCRQQHDYAEKVLEGVIEDASYFPMVYTLDEADDWQDESCWAKSNPNLGVSLRIADMRTQAEQAKQLPSKENSFRRLRLNQWTETVTRWIGDDKWKACTFEIDEEALRGRECYAGLDLSSTTDLTALVYVFPPTEDDLLFRIVPRFFVPEDNIMERAKRDRVPYDVWRRQGYLCATPGNVVDYDFILHMLAQDREKFVIMEVAYDRWGAEKIRRDIAEMDLVVVPFGQGFESMKEPTAQLQRIVLGRLMAHGGNPILRWNAANTVVRMDAAGCMKPDKSKSTERIDGIVALIMGLARALVQENTKSIYESRGVLTFGTGG
jgi:phage terminase large subunit-like protein